jgi:elongation factor 1-gamma
LLIRYVLKAHFPPLIFIFINDSYILKAYRASFPNVVRWFTTCVNQKEFKEVVGEVVLAQTEIGGSASSSSGAAVTNAPKEKKEKKEKAPKVAFPSVI